MSDVGGLTVTGKLLVLKLRLSSLLSYIGNVNKAVLKSPDLKVSSVMGR